jgi:hypothetical protein
MPFSYRLASYKHSSRDGGCSTSITKRYDCKMSGDIVTRTRLNMLTLPNFVVGQFDL